MEKRFLLLMMLFACIMSVAIAEGSVGGVLSIGDHVTMGTYPQTETGTDKTPIEWLILDVQGDQALLISRYGLETKAYNTIEPTYVDVYGILVTVYESVDVTWETCTLREWLNKDFFDMAFTAEEQKAILTTDVDNSWEQRYVNWYTVGGNDTRDKVFLLSYAEANRYFNVTLFNNKNIISRAAPTAYAEKKSYPDENKNTADGTAASRWWLRSPGYHQYSAAYIDFDGSLSSVLAECKYLLVRPVIWIDMSAIAQIPE